ncbi:MAG: hypothetical protein AAF404_16265, partial [Pseudomonadota bacterium]
MPDVNRDIFRDMSKSATLWLVLLLVLLVAGLAFRFYVMVPPELTEIGNAATAQSIISDLDAMQSDYRQLREEHKSIADTWGVIAVILGAIGSAAALLRAPQLVIVLIAALGGVSYGALQLHSPQALLDGLNRARERVSCLTPLAHAIAATDTISAGSILNATDNARALLKEYDSNVVKLRLRRSNLVADKTNLTDISLPAIEVINKALTQVP